MATTAVRQTGFFFNTLSGRTKLRPGDYFTLLAGSEGYTSSNLLLLRDDGSAIGIMSEDGKRPISDARKRFSREDARLIATAMAAASGFALEEATMPSDYWMTNI